MKQLRVPLLCLAFALPAACFGQWQWIDKDGRKVFSDQPPPSEVPIKSILAQPGPKGRSGPVIQSNMTAADAPPAAAASEARPAKPSVNPPKLSGKDKVLEDKKKQLEAAEAEKKKTQEEELARLRADNCSRAKRTKATFDSGVRIARTNEKGEREFLDDASRATEAKRLDGVIASDCKSAAGG